ncbi:MAG: flagellar filament capping protein FliD, partial [Deltaproteobacteria bacterium]
MSNITFPGLASGLDVTAIVDGLVNFESQPITKLQTKQSQIQSASQTISTFATKLATLQTAARALATPGGFGAFAATSSDSAIVATATGAASPGAFSVSVTALAQEQRTYSGTQASATAALGWSGTLQIGAAGGTPASIAVTADDTLSSIATKIGSSGQRVSASVLYDGTNYRLQLRGLDTGAASALSISESGFSSGLADPANTAQNAQDAVLTVDGLSIHRSTNQVTGVVPGVTLALTRLTTTPATVQVNSDSTALQQKLATFVNAYNDIVSSGHTAAGFGGQKAANPTLAGDRAIRSTLDSLSGVLSSAIAGTGGRYTTLYSVGVGRNGDGTLKLDSTKLSAALQADSTGVARLFVTDPAIGATGVMQDI